MKAHRTEQDIYRADCARDRRVMMRELGRCICGPSEGFVSRNGVAHGPVVSGGRCARCVEVKRGVRS